LLECDYFPYLAAAAFLAISLRSSGDSFSALALPPFDQPRQAHGNARPATSDTGTRSGEAEVSAYSRTRFASSAEVKS